MEYNLRFEYELEPNEENGDQLVAALEAFSPAAGPAGVRAMDVWITVQAVDVRQAVTLGQALSQQAVDAPLVGFEVLTTEEFDRRQRETPMPDLIGSDEAAELLGMTRQAVGKKFASGKLPGVRVGDRTIVFARRDVEKAVAQQAENDRFLDAFVATQPDADRSDWERAAQQVRDDEGRTT